MAAAERRLARVRFDLHDGPQQDLMLLAEDLRLFRSQLDSVLSESDKRECLLGRIDDLEARLTALDGDLRRIAVSAESPFLHGESLQDAVVELVGAFAERAGIEPEVRLEGDFTGLSESQHITLLGLMRESLSNIREHSHAKHVWIAISGGPAGVEATVTDDGRGFEPEATLVKAAREGHLGLVGMHERVRLLGGHTEIDSRPGGPTAISVKLPKAPEGAARRGSHTRRRASG
jgi:signal transduction histidine kinase